MSEMSFRNLSWDKIYRTSRKWFYWYFNKNYIYRSIARRRGGCEKGKCWACCNDVLVVPCPYLDKEKGCTVFMTEKMPVGCYIYPFDEKDKNKMDKDKCLFYWVDDTTPKEIEKVKKIIKTLQRGAVTKIY